MDVVEIPMFGGKFTWVKSDGSVTTKLDLFLLFDWLVEF